MDAIVLINACRKGDSESVKSLIESGANVNSIDKSGNSPLHVASDRGYLECVSMLIEAGAKVNSIDGSGISPLHCACIQGNSDCVSLLIESGADVNQSGGWIESTPLLFICDLNPAFHVDYRHKYCFCVEMLIKAGADVNKKDYSYNTPLHLACEQGKTDIVDLLIGAGANVNELDSYNSTPLHIACLAGNLGCIEKLLVMCCPDVGILNRDGKTAFDLITSDECKAFIDKILGGKGTKSAR